MDTTPRQAQAEDLLHAVFGLQAFRPGQAEIVGRLLARQNALVVMPTGAGKPLNINPDEPKILRYANPSNCPMGADVRHTTPVEDRLHLPDRLQIHRSIRPITGAALDVEAGTYIMAAADVALVLLRPVAALGAVSV
ncbi:MAG: hypothetical protein RQ748_12250, partial [Elusimicrobiales bacterium]|nr:hypothetical protein [Elusimicrobiales bacterium]